MTATTTDDDVAGPPSLKQVDPQASPETGSTDTFTVVLNAQPNSDVVLAITSSDTGETTVTGSLTFTNGNWNTAQTVTVTGVDDNIIDGSVNSALTVMVVDAASDNNFDAVADQTVTATTTDNDVACSIASNRRIHKRR